MGKNMLAPSFVYYHLKRKVLGKKLWFEAIYEVNIYKYAPWDLPDESCIKNMDLSWYFFCPLEKKYASKRSIRVTEYGYWKVIGKDCPIYHNKKVVGMMKTLVFHQGKGSRGSQTDWMMHEYRLDDKDLEEKGIVQDAYVLCVVFKKDGPGVSLREEDCDVQAVSPIALHKPSFAFATDPFVLKSHCLGSSVESSHADTLDMILDEMVTTTSMESPQLSDDSILSMLAIFTEEPSFAFATDPFLPKSHCLGSSVESSHADTLDMILDEMVTTTSMESPQLSDDSILSMLAILTEESTTDSPEMEDDFSVLVNAFDFMEAPEFSLDGEGDDISSILATFIEHDDFTPKFMDVPQLSDDSILSMLETFTEDSMTYSEEMGDGPPVVADASDSTELSQFSVPSDKYDILSMLENFIED